jgi:predicted transcriptional regulator
MREPNQHWLTADDTFEDAVHMFDQQALEFLSVLDKDRRLEGLVRRDELFEAFAQGKTPATKVRDFMRADAGAVTLGDTILTVGELMNKQDLFWLPVVESKQDRRLIGIIRSENVLRFTVEQSRTDRSVA